MITLCLLTLALTVPAAMPGKTKKPSHELAILQGPGVNVPTVLARLTGHPKESYMLLVEAEGLPPALLDAGQLGATGRLELSFTMPPEAFGADLAFRANFKHKRRIVPTGPVAYGAGHESTIQQCLTFDFERKLVPEEEQDGFVAVETVPGEVIFDQWLIPYGFLFGAFNASPYPSHPDACVLFDSFNPTGGDSDLASPPQGGQEFPDGGSPVIPIEPQPYGRILIIQEHDDGCGDGVCDEPDDEVAGGAIEMVSLVPPNPGQGDGEVIVLLRPIVMCSMDLVDVDEEAPVFLDDDGPPTEAGAIVITFTTVDPQGLEAALPLLVEGNDPPDLTALMAHDGLAIADLILVPKGPNNGFKRVFFSETPVVAWVVLFLSSGAVAEFRYHPAHIIL